jgi:hypothetical protein
MRALAALSAQDLKTLVVLTALFAAAPSVHPQDPPRSGTYQIQSGKYRSSGGWSYTETLPIQHQAVVSLMIAPDGTTASLSFLDSSQQYSFSIFSNGVVSDNVVRFQYMTVHPYRADLPAYVDYVVTNTAGSLWISGSITSALVCCDFPYRLAHSNVIARFMPQLAMRVADNIELRWTSALNQTSQVQRLSELTPGGWTNVSEFVQGNGTTNYWMDTNSPTQSSMFYRIVTAQ